MDIYCEWLYRFMRLFMCPHKWKAIDTFEGSVITQKCTRCHKVKTIPKNDGKCHHKWEVIKETLIYSSCGGDVGVTVKDAEKRIPSGRKYTLQCKKCGEIIDRT